MIDILFVCLGNICRSPVAEGVARSMREQFPFIGRLDSAGTSAYHIGEAPHPLMRKISLENGVSIEDLKARQIETIDFSRFDFIVAMDSENKRDILSIQPGNTRAKVVKLLDFHAGSERNVADPYYGGVTAFHRCFNTIREGMNDFFNILQKQISADSYSEASSKRAKP